MDEREIINIINNFPIGDQGKNRIELLSKAEIISYLSRFQEQFHGIENVDDIEFNVKQFLKDAIGLKDGEIIPDLFAAERILKLSSGFLQDYNKVQLIKEKNPLFDKTFDIIASSMELTNNHFKSR